MAGILWRGNAIGESVAVLGGRIPGPIVMVSTRPPFCFQEQYSCSEQKPTLQLSSKGFQQMQADELRARQAPLKERYQKDPQAARVTLTARGDVSSPGIACRVNTARGPADAGLHPATGGDGLSLCSGDMLLEALVACAGVTLRAVATALEIPLHGGTVTAQGEIDFRGTLSVSKEAAVGLERISLQFDLNSDATEEQLASLIKLTERFCVILQTLKQPPEISVSASTISA